MKRFLRLIYNNVDRLPVPILIFAMRFNVSPRLAFGREYSELYRTLVERRGDNNKDRLLEVVNKVFQEVPFYREKGYGPILSVDDFELKVKTIDKDIVLDHFESFINPNVDIKKYDKGTTGGTSGKPLKLLMCPNRYVTELATMHYLWSKVGYSFHVRAVIRNHKLNDGQVFKVNPITKEIIFDGFKLNNEYFEQIYKVLFKYKVRFLHCYPSTAYEFSKFLYNTNKDVSFIRSFLCGSENVITHHRDFIVNNLGVNFFSFYGHSEKLVLGGTTILTDKGINENYVFENSYGYFELLDETGNVIKEVGKVGEIVGTSLNNIGMPLVRYRTGDYASYVTMDSVSSTNVKVPVVSPILGRWAGDKIYNSDGSFVTTTALNLHSDIYEKIDGIQYVQDIPGELNVLIIQGKDYTSSTESSILKHFTEALSADAKIVIKYVSSLIKKDNGKFLLLNSSIQKRFNI
jgi:phenylacetate-CoA ligase